MGQKGNVLYVGKAKNLRSRINSYKQINQSHKKTNQLIRIASKLKFKELDSEIDALIIEAGLIKLHQPKFNIRLKDDKSPIYIVITDDKYPKIKPLRKNQIKGKLYKKNVFGPFDSSFAVKKILKFIRKNISFCSAKDDQIEKGKACFYFHIGLCSGICAGKISSNDYQDQINKIRLLLKGKKQKVVSSLKSELNNASSNLNFEEAGKIKEKIHAFTHQSYKNEVEKNLPILSEDLSYEKLLHLKKILKKFYSLPSKYSLKRIEGYDISNTQGKNPTGSMVVFTDAKPAGDQYRMFAVKSKDTPDDPGMMAEVLSRRVNHDEWGIPQLIVIDGGKTQLAAAQNEIKWNIPVVSLVKNPDRLLIKKEGKYYFIPLGDDPTSQLLRSIRDESHRFAKNYHKKLRSKKMIKVI